MWRFLKSPLVRISFSLVMLTVAILLIADLLGLVPDTKNEELQSRKVIAESLAVQLSIEIADRQLHSVEEILRSVVERNDSVLSGAVRMRGGNLLSEYGGHGDYWTLQAGDKSTTTQVQVPLFNEEVLWGSIELRFKALAGKGYGLSFRSSFLAVILFMALAGFLAYLLFLKRAMRELDPDAVIPERVRKALDTLAEGLLIVDNDGYIVFSNTVFANKTGLRPKQLIGKKSTGLDWEFDPVAEDSRELPWLRVLDGEELLRGVKVRLRTALTVTYTFTVNVSAITASADKIRGALITFDDITEIEIKNEELHRTLDKLEHSKREITRQNQELQVLATRDPLTGALNRRSLFQGFEALFAEAQEEGEELSCIMVDIDHFKSVNDRFGHAVGDKVIKLLVDILTEHSRPNDLVGRFGGEEFIVVLPGADIKVAAGVAERMRLAVQEGHGAKFANAPRITSSFGVSTLAGGASSPKELVDQADKALYAAKEGGRNRVISWSSALEEEAPEGTSTPPLDEPVSEPAKEQSTGPAGKNEGELRKTPHVVDETLGQDDKLGALHMQNKGPQNVHQQQGHAQDDNPGNQDVIYMPKRVLLMDRIDWGIKLTQRHDTQLAVLFMNIDTLQRVNDTLGLVVGEKSTKTLVARLKQALRSTDTVALIEQDELLFSISRLDGHEMVAVLNELKQTEIVTSVLQRIFSALKEPIEVEGHEIYINVNVGVSVFPLDGGGAEMLIRNASSAMREAKKNPGRNNFRFYADEINQRAKKQIQLEAELHRALERGELIVYYQPKVDLKTGGILGLEALVRWQHPRLGIVPPNDFIPLAEQTGLIEEVGRWVVRVACRQIRFWQEAGYGTVPVAVNLSPVEFRNPDLGDQIIAMVDELGIPASALEVEITETVVMQNMDTAVGILEKLSNAGLRISIDDFGTGYSSLSYLKRFPLSSVKIDRAFIADFMRSSNDAAIVSAIIAMSHSLGLRVVAEGVETEEQLRFLQDLHCDEMQGYLVSKPVPREEVSELLAQTFCFRHMVQECGVNYAGLMDHQAADSASGMIGILNDFPVKDAGPLN